MNTKRNKYSDQFKRMIIDVYSKEGEFPTWPESPSLKKCACWAISIFAVIVIISYLIVGIFWLEEK